MKHQRTVKDDNMMHESLRQPQDEQRGQGQPRQQVLIAWAVREPRRSRRTRRELNYSKFASRGSEVGTLSSTSNHSASRSKNLGKSKVQEKEVLKAVKHRKRVQEHQITKGLSKRTKEPAENIKAHVQRENVESLHNQELQISARTEAEAKKNKKRETDLAVMKAEIKRIKEEQERINLKISARREEELKETAKRRKELHILKNNIISLTKEHNKLKEMTKAHIQGEVLTQEVVCMSADTEVLEVSSVGQEAVTSGETHVQEVSSSKHQMLKVVSSGETHVPDAVSTSLPAALEEDRFVLPDLNDPLF